MQSKGNEYLIQQWKSITKNQTFEIIMIMIAIRKD